MLEFINVESKQSLEFKRNITQFEQHCLSHLVTLHGFILCKGKDILVEKYYAPYSSDTQHRMYSITKSLTSLSIGLLINEGKLSLKDKITDYFPEYTSSNSIHPYLKELTIENMLTMQTCFYKTTYKEYEDYNWAKSFFEVTPDHKPGTVFSYDTSSSQVLAELTEKLTGMQMLDYLRINALDKIGFSKEAYILNDPSGISQGGTGLNCTLRDILKLSYLLNHFGIINSEELLPSNYIKRATEKHVPTSIQAFPDEAQGYGYMFWKMRKEGFLMYGMGGQLALCFPTLDLCFVTMGDTMGYSAALQALYDGFYTYLYPFFDNDNEVLSSPAERVSLTLGNYFSELPNSKITAIKISKDSFIVESDSDTYTILYEEGSIKTFEFSKDKLKAYSKVRFEDGHVYLYINIMDSEQGNIRLDILEKENTITIRMESSSHPRFNIFKGCLTLRKCDND